MKKTRFNEVEINEETKQLVFNARNATAFDAPSRDSLRTADMETLSEPVEEKYEYKGVKYAHHAKMTVADASLILDDVSTTVTEYCGENGIGVAMEKSYPVVTEDEFHSLKPQNKIVCSEAVAVMIGQAAYMPDCFLTMSSAEYIDKFTGVSAADPTATIEINAASVSLKKFALMIEIANRKVVSEEVYFTE